MMHNTWDWLVNWTSRMTVRFGGEVYDRQLKRGWDWGQALMREIYGEDWQNHPGFDEVNDIPPDEPAPDILLTVARSWERGEWPKWAKRSGNR